MKVDINNSVLELVEGDITEMFENQLKQEV